MTQALRWQRWLPEFVLLGMIWGSSFVFMHMTSQQFGTWTTAWLRVSVAVLVLLPFLLWNGHSAALKRHWRTVMTMGVINSGIPFICFAYAVLHISTGMSSILNCISPLFGALIAWLWLGERPGHWRAFGMLLGFIGAALLAAGVGGGLSFDADANGWAMLACLVATACYGTATSISQRYLSGVPPLVIATGSQMGACLFLILPGLWFHPTQVPTASAWVGLLMIGAVSTALAYMLYFRLIAKTGGSRTLSVTYLVPLFANIIGVVFLDETLTLRILLCGGLILLGTAMANGMFMPAFLRRR